MKNILTIILLLPLFGYCQFDGKDTLHAVNIVATGNITTGGTNKNGGGATFYMEYEAGYKAWLTLSRIGGSGDFVIETSMFNLLMYYAE